MTWVCGTVRCPLAFVVGVATSALAGILCTTGAGLASHLPDRLFESPASETGRALTKMIGPEIMWQRIAGETRHGSLAQWTHLGASASSNWTTVPVPRLRAEGAVKGGLAELISIPINIRHSDRLNPRAVVAVSNVPEHAALSLGKPLGAGVWIIPSDALEHLSIISYALPSQQQLIFDLLAPDGRSISTARVRLELTAS